MKVEAPDTRKLEQWERSQNRWHEQTFRAPNFKYSNILGTKAIGDPHIPPRQKKLSRRQKARISLKDV